MLDYLAQGPALVHVDLELELRFIQLQSLCHLSFSSLQDYKGEGSCNKGEVFYAEVADVLVDKGALSVAT